MIRLFLTIFLGITLLFGQTFKSKVVIEQSHGQIIGLTTKSFSQSGNLLSKIECFDKNCDKRNVEIHIYDDKNQLVIDSSYHIEKGKFDLRQVQTYTYYDNGLLKSESVLSQNCNNFIGITWSYYYDTNGRLYRTYFDNVCNYFGTSDYPIYYQYDSIGNKLSKTALNYADTTLIFYQNQYEYDKAGNLIKDSYYYADGKDLPLSSVLEYSYDSNNKLIYERKISDSTIYKYNGNGLLQIVDDYPFNDRYFMVRTKLYYDKNGKHTKSRNYFYQTKKKMVAGSVFLMIYEYY